MIVLLSKTEMCVFKIDSQLRIQLMYCISEKRCKRMCYFVSSIVFRCIALTKNFSWFVCSLSGAFSYTNVIKLMFIVKLKWIRNWNTFRAIEDTSYYEKLTARSIKQHSGEVDEHVQHIITHRCYTYDVQLSYSSRIGESPSMHMSVCVYLI